MLSVNDVEIASRSDRFAPAPLTASAQVTDRHAPRSGAFASSIEKSSIRRFSPKEHIFCEGDDRTHIYRIEEGVVMIYRMLPDGRRQVVEFAYPGDFIGLGADGPHRFNAETSSKVTVACFTAATLGEAAHHNPELALSLYHAVSLELSAARDLLIAIGQRSAIERLSSFLLMLYRRSARLQSDRSDTTIELPMRRADIADLLGLTIETVSRTLTKLRTMRIIKIGRAAEISITDIHHLEKLAVGNCAAMPA